jgi:hypothetical protein
VRPKLSRRPERLESRGDQAPLTLIAGEGKSVSLLVE